MCLQNIEAENAVGVVNSDDKVKIETRRVHVTLIEITYIP